MSSDIAAIITADTSGFTDAIAEAEGESASFWATLTSNGRAALSEMGNALAAIAAETASIAGGIIHQVSVDFGVMAAKTAIVGAAASAATSYFFGFWNTLRTGLSVASWFVPWLKVVTISLTAATIGVWAYGKADEYLNGELTKSLTNFSQTSAAIEDLKEQASAAAETFGILSDGSVSIGAQLAQQAIYWSGLGTAIKTVDTIAATSIQAVSTSVGFLSTKWMEGADILTDFVSSAGAGAAELRAMAAASDELIAKQEAQSALYGQLRAMQEGAAATAAHSAEISRIGSLTTIDAINNEINALQQKAAAAIAAGTADEESQKKTAQLFLALENQKNAVNSGKMTKPPEKSSADQAIEQAYADLRKLSLGQDEAAISALVMEGATQAQIDTFRTLRDEIAELTEAEKKRQKKELIDTQAGSQIASITDQIDLLTGSADKADIAMRQALRAGLSKEKAEEIRDLTAELDRLQQKETKPEKKPKAQERTSLKAAFAGSSEAASIFLRGLGGPKTLEQIGQKTNALLQQVVTNTKSNKTQDLQPLKL